MGNIWDNMDDKEVTMKDFLVKCIKTAKEVVLLVTLIVPVVKGLWDACKITITNIKKIWG